MIHSGAELYPPRTVVEYITEFFKNSIQVISDFIALQITAIRGYFDEIFTRKITADDVVTQTLCVANKVGAKTCINKGQLDAILASFAHT
jgi:hypothetical protein